MLICSNGKRKEKKGEKNNKPAKILLVKPLKWKRVRSDYYSRREKSGKEQRFILDSTYV